MRAIALVLAVVVPAAVLGFPGVLDFPYDSIDLGSNSAFAKQSDGGGGDDKLKSTDLCNPGRLENFFEDFDVCEKEADAILDEAFARGTNVPTAFCNVISAKVQSLQSNLGLTMTSFPPSFQVACQDNIGPRCFNEERLDIVKTNYLYKQLQKAHNVTSLGQDFINACGVLSRSENYIVKTLTGSNNCKFVQFEQVFKTWDECTDGAVEGREKALEYLSLAPNKR